MEMMFIPFNSDLKDVISVGVMSIVSGPAVCAPKKRQDYGAAGRDAANGSSKRRVKRRRPQKRKHLPRNDESVVARRECERLNIAQQGSDGKASAPVTGELNRLLLGVDGIDAEAELSEMERIDTSTAAKIESHC